MAGFFIRAAMGKLLGNTGVVAWRLSTVRLCPENERSPPGSTLRPAGRVIGEGLGVEKSNVPNVDSPWRRSFSGPKESKNTMAKYMLMLGGADLDKRSGNAAIAPKLYEQFAKWVGSVRESGRYVGS